MYNEARFIISKKVDWIEVSNVIDIEVVLDLDVKHVDFVTVVGDNGCLSSNLSLLLLLTDHFVLSLHLLLNKLLLSALEFCFLGLLRSLLDDLFFVLFSGATILIRIIIRVFLCLSITEKVNFS
jgi:hypothetical protein